MTIKMSRPVRKAFLICLAACILASWAGIKLAPIPPPLPLQWKHGLNHWTTREGQGFLIKKIYYITPHSDVWKHWNFVLFVFILIIGLTLLFLKHRVVWIYNYTKFMKQDKQEQFIRNIFAYY